MRRSLRVLLAAWLAVPLLLVLSAEAHAAPPLVTTSPLQKLFFDYGDAGTGDRWTGSDGAYSVPLPDGRNVWLWGDTFLGTVRPDHSRKQQGFIHHAFTMMNADGTLGETIYKKNDGFGDRALVHTADGQTWYWLGDGVVEGDKYRQFLYRIGGATIVGVDVATFSLPTFTLEGVTSMPGAYIPGQGYPRQYGVSIVEEDDYTYVYGCETPGPLAKELHVARVPRGQLITGTWEYWTGTEWSTLPALSARIRSGVADEMSVVKTKTGYRAVASLVGIGDEIYMYTAPRPEGPWSKGTLLYRTPETNNKTLTYNAKEHEQFAGSDYITISYNVNVQSTNTNGLYTNVDNYRPRWKRVYIPSDLDVAPQVQAFGDRYSTLRDATLTVAAPGLLGNDTVGAQTTAALAQAPAHGSVTVDPDGAFRYLPAAGYVGADSFTYELRDGSAVSTGTVDIDVVTPPVEAVADNYSTMQEATLTVAAPGVLGNDTAGADASATLAAPPTHGTVSMQPDGAFTYVPADGYVGGDAFTYEVREGSAVSTGTVDIDVVAETLRDVECDASAVVRTGHWSAVTDPVARGGRYCTANAPSSGTVRESRLTFTGDRVDVAYVTHPDAGRLTVLVDGRTVATIGQHGYTRESRVYRVRRLAPGAHTVTVRAEPGVGTGKAIVTLDGFAVL